MPVLTTFNCDALTGGTDRALDAIPVASLVDGCRALVALDGAFLVFVFDADGTDAEETDVRPFKIRPDDYSSAGVWIEQWNGVSNENRIHNGCFDIWQRGEGTGDQGSSLFTADRWFMVSTVNYGFWKIEFAEGQQAVEGNPDKHLKLNLVNAGTYWWQQRHEISWCSGREITFSFYAKASRAFSGNDHVHAFFTQNHGSGGDATLHTTIINTAPITTVWKKFAYTIIVPSVEGKTLGTNPHADIMFEINNDAEIGIYFANIKLEYGPLATPMVRKSVAREMLDCQRYFQIYNFAQTYAGSMPFRNSQSGTQMVGPYVPFVVPMRVAPSMVNSTGGKMRYTDHLQNTYDGATDGLMASITADGFVLKENKAGTNGYMYLGQTIDPVPVLEFSAEY